MPQQELNLEQNDFSAGFLSDVNPLEFPPNATVDEANFQIEKDKSRKRREGLEFDRDGSGNIITPDADFYSYYKVRSKVFSTISPNATLDTSYPSRKKDVVTLTDDRSPAGSIKSFDASDDSLTELALSAVNGNSPYTVTQHITKQAYTSVNASNQYIVSLIYGWKRDTEEEGVLGVTSAPTVKYDGGKTVDQRDTRLSELTSWSGRLVYGFNSADDTRGYAIGISALPDPTTSSASQIGILAQCQQVGDSLLGTDGAWIFVGDLGKIERIVPFRTGLVIFTEENIWFLSATDGYFDPYNFSFDKLSSTRVAGNNSIVTVDKSIFFWAESGIFVLYPDENTGFPVIQNLTAGKIEKYYEALLPDTKINARGVYNKKRNELRWLYASDPTQFDLADKLRFDEELILSLSSGAWSRNEFGSNDDTFIMDFIPDRSATETFDEAFVVADSDDVMVGTERVYVEFLTAFSVTSSFKYVVRDGGTTARLAALENKDFLDFNGSVGFPNGSDAAARIKTGWFTFTGTQRKKTPNWLTATFEMTETGYDVSADALIDQSSCKLTAYWNYANDNYAGKKHGPYQIYRLNRLYMPDVNNWDYGQEFITTKNKIRGRGRTLQFKFETEPGKDCRLYSWGFNGTVLTRV